MTVRPPTQLDLITSFIFSTNDYNITQKQIIDALSRLRLLQADQNYQNISPGVKLTIDRGLETEENTISKILSTRREAYETAVGYFADLYNESSRKGSSIEVLERKIYNYTSRYNYASKLESYRISEIDEKIEALVQTNRLLKADLEKVKKPIDFYTKSIQRRYNHPEINVLEIIIQECKKDPIAREKFAITADELSFENIPPSFK